FILLANVRAQFALADRVNEGVNLAILTACLQFDTAVGQIPNPASDIEAFGDLFDRPTKAYALNITFEQNLERDHLLQAPRRCTARIRVSEGHFNLRLSF
ncbi:MAG: hypothetical protein ACRD5Z_18590, partial [Bryobacteraceae bacterium]